MAIAYCLVGAPLQDPWSLLVHVGGQREVTASINYMGKTGWQPWWVSFRTRPGSEKGLPSRRELCWERPVCRSRPKRVYEAC